MSKKELTDYTARAKELEAAIFTQSKLMSVQEVINQEQTPVRPQKRNVYPPCAPICPKRETVISPAMWPLAILLLITGLFGLIGLFAGAFLGLIMVFLFGGPGIYLVVLWINTNKEEDERYNQSKSIYQQKLLEYSNKMDEYNNQLQLATDEYKEAIIQYEMDTAKHNDACLTVMNKHNEILNLLTNALEQHYSQNVIFAKYRNLIAISSIHEYLLSGRCDTLEGANGAYNLFEMELRQNIVIGQLSSIIDNLDQIKNNQYSLYQELQQANNTINQIAYEIRETQNNTKLTAYFSSVTALAAVSPTYTIGMIC